MREWLQTIFVYVIIITILGSLCSKGQYYKILKFVSGIILLIIIVNPVIKEGGIDRIISKYVYAGTNNYVLSEIKDSYERVDKEQQKFLIEEYKRGISEDIDRNLQQEGLYVREIYIEVVEDYESEYFGAVQSLELGVDTGIRDSTIKIERIFLSDKEEIRAKSGEEILLEKKVKEMINELYNVAISNINITIHE